MDALTFRRSLTSALAPHLKGEDKEVRQLMAELIDLLCEAFERAGIVAARSAMDEFYLLRGKLPLRLRRSSH